ncbi:MAG: mechanosensitive ion channel [Thermoanaerobaculia bacterium]|nr:mechanosensitive ion channel [Thermoanaerobaculia bacterium]
MNALLSFIQPLQTAAENAERLKEELRATPHNLQEVVADLVDRFIRHLPGAITGIIVFLFFWLLSRFAMRLVRRLAQRARSDEALRELLVPLTRFAVLAIGVLMALDQMGFEVRSLIAGLGIAGLAVGLAAQETMANIFAGFTILWDQPYRLGDTVTMAGNQGQVSEIGLRSTRIRTFDQREVILPNKEVIQQPIVNHSRSPAMRIDAAVAVAYGIAVDRVREVLLQAARRDLPVLDTPEPQVVVTALGESAVTVELRVWVADPLAPTSSRFLLLEVAKRAMEEAGLEIPFPQRVVRVIGDSAGR